MPNIYNYTTIRIAAINLKTIANTNVFRAKASRELHLRRVYYKRTWTGTGTEPTVSLGTNSTSYDNATNAQALNPDAGLKELIIGASAAPPGLVNITTLPLILRVSIASTYTTDVMDLFVECIEVP